MRTEREDRAECEAFGRMVHMIVKAGGRPPDCVPCVKVSVRTGQGVRTEQSVRTGQGVRRV